MTRTVRAFVVAIFAVSYTACAPAPAGPAMNAPEDLAAVNTLRTSYQTAYNAGSADDLGNLYTADAVSMANHQATVSGRDAVVANMRAMFEGMTMSVEIVPEETMTMGNFGFDRGHARVTVTPKAGGAAMTDESRYIVLLEKSADGTWRVSRDIDNSSMPMPMAMPAPMSGTMSGM